MRRVFIHESVTFNFVNQIYELFLLLRNLSGHLFTLAFFLTDYFCLSFSDDLVNNDDFLAYLFNLVLEPTDLGRNGEARLVFDSVFTKNSLHVFKLFLLVYQTSELLACLTHFIDILNE